MTPEQLPGYMWLVIKLMSLLGLGVYTLFAGVMVRQEQLMANVLEEQFEPVLRVATIIHFIAACGVFLLALFLL